MSLVNDMLRDLDQRRQGPGGGAVAEIAPAMHRAESRKPLLWGAILAGVALIALAVYVFVPGLIAASGTVDRRPAAAASAATVEGRAADTVADISENSIVRPQPSEIAAAPVAVLSAEPESGSIDAEQPQPLQIGVAGWQTVGQGVRLLLNSPVEPAYSIRAQQARRLQVRFGNARLGSPLPEFPAALVRAAMVRPEGSALVLELQTEVNASFKLWTVRNDDQYQLIIESRPRVSAPSPGARPAAQENTAAPENVAGPEAVAALKDSAASEDSGRSENTVMPAKAAPQEQETQAPRPVRPLVKTAKVLTPAQVDRQQLQRATALIRKGRGKDAEQRLRAFLTRQPAAPQSRRLLASLLVASQQLKQASQLISEGLEMTPDHAGLRKVSARIQLQNGKPAEAVEILQNPAPRLSEDPEFFQLRAVALQRAGQHDSASRIYYQLLQLDSTRASWWVGLAISLEALGSTEQASQAYQNVLQIPAVTPTLVKFARQRIGRLGR